MRTEKTLFFAGILAVLLLSSCKNKELELANKALENSSEHLKVTNEFILIRLAKEADKDEKARPLYQKGLEVDSIIQNVIENNNKSARYIIQNYDSLSARFIDFNCSEYSKSIDKNTNYQTAKNKLLYLEFEILEELLKSVSVSSCCFCNPFENLNASFVNTKDSTTIVIYTDMFSNLVIKPNSVNLWLLNEENEEKLKQIKQEVDFQIQLPYVIMKTSKLPKGKIGVTAKLEVPNVEFYKDFGASGYIQ